MNTNFHGTLEFTSKHALAALNVMAAGADPIVEAVSPATCKQLDTNLRAAAKAVPTVLVHETDLHRFRHLADELAVISGVNGETIDTIIVDADVSAAKGTVGTDASVKLADALHVEAVKRNPRTLRATSIGHRF
jgi:hypothetical protein